jgi:prepilin-type processing-associated H-X9-DG protein
MRTGTVVGITLAGVVALGCIGTMVLALLLPAVQGARESARRMQCGNNIRQLVLGLQNYHDTFGVLPYGARTRTTGPALDQPSWGSSWLLATLPFCESSPDFEQIIQADQAATENDYISTALWQIANNRRFRYMICPSSPFSQMQTLAGYNLCLPSYAGIMGATNDPSLTDQHGRIVAGPYGGFAAGNGMLLINQCPSISDCVDGDAFTIVVSEVSDYYYTDARERRITAMSVGNAGEGAKNEAGWLAGTNLGIVDVPQDLPRSLRPATETPPGSGRYATFVFQGGPAIPPDSVLNLVTIHHPLGSNNRGGTGDPAPDWGAQGIGRCGLNNPILSAHPSGAMVGFLDGHVQFMTKRGSLEVLKKLANRDDGGGELVP